MSFLPSELTSTSYKSNKLISFLVLDLLIIMINFKTSILKKGELKIVCLTNKMNGFN